MDRRIFGIENEYGVTCTFKGQRRLSPDEVARYLFRKVVSWGRSSNVFLRNGARLYLDVGSHPEYATPECDDIIDLVTHDKAGERVLEGLLVDAERRLHDEGIAGDVYLFKNNTDSAGNSYGCHENYLVRRQGDFGRLADVLVPFLITRQVVTGAGKVLPTSRGATGSLTSKTVTSSSPDITKSGAECRKQPEMPALPGRTAASRTLGELMNGTASPASYSCAIRSARSRSPWAWAAPPERTDAVVRSPTATARAGVASRIPAQRAGVTVVTARASSAAR